MVWKLLCKVREERGQGLVLAALSMVVVMGFAAMAVDVGSFMHDRRQLQNAADAAALAGAAGLPDASLAEEKAHEWATKNFDGSDQVVASVNVYTYRAPNDRIEVTVKGETDFVFARVLGMDKATVRASATAGRVPITASCIAPWAVKGVVNDATANFGLDPTALYVFHDDDWTTPGNFGALAVYGGGVNEYRNAIVGNCGQVNACDSDSPYVAEGQTLSCNTQTGVAGKNTHSALEERYPQSTWATCDVQPDASGYTNAQSKAQLSTCKDRAVPMAVINDFPPQGHSGSVDIWGLASFYIAGWDRKAPWGDGGMVWGYLIPATSLPAWSVKWGWDNANPFAPLVIVLVK
jgi:Flp pilus assembly protein TadG